MMNNVQKNEGTVLLCMRIIQLPSMVCRVSRYQLPMCQCAKMPMQLFIRSCVFSFSWASVTLSTLLDYYN